MLRLTWWINEIRSKRFGDRASLYSNSPFGTVLDVQIVVVLFGMFQFYFFINISKAFSDVEIFMLITKNYWDFVLVTIAYIKIAKYNPIWKFVAKFDIVNSIKKIKHHSCRQQPSSTSIMRQCKSYIVRPCWWQRCGGNGFMISVT